MSRPKATTHEGESDFGSVLQSLRRERKLSQEELGQQLDLSQSYIARVEKGERTFSPEVIRQLSERWSLASNVTNRLFALAGHLPTAASAKYQSHERDPDQESAFQKIFPGLQEVWVISREPLDLNELYETIKNNIRKGVKYVYFQIDDLLFKGLVEKLKQDGIELNHKVECILSPPALFITSFAIYNPGRDTMVGWSSKLERGRPSRIYLMDDEQLRFAYYSVLRPVYEALRNLDEIDTSSGKFSRLNGKNNP